MLHLSSAVSGEEVHRFGAEEVEGKSVKELKLSFAYLIAKALFLFVCCFNMALLLKTCFCRKTLALKYAFTTTCRPPFLRFVLLHFLVSSNLRKSEFAKQIGVTRFRLKLFGEDGNELNEEQRVEGLSHV